MRHICELNNTVILNRKPIGSGKFLNQIVEILSIIMIDILNVNLEKMES